MTKTTDINDVITTRSPELMLDMLWDDPVMIERIRFKLDKASATNIKFYHKYFCVNIEEVKK